MEEEQAFLTPFFSRAEQGEIATAGEFKRAFEARWGRAGGGKYDLSFTQTAWLAQTRCTCKPHAFACIRGYLSTLRKHGIPVLTALEQALVGHPVFHAF